MKKLNNSERDLLVRDLLPRIFYGVKAEIYEDGGSITEQLHIGGLDHLWHSTLNVIPYLRPMSSMTNEERNEYNEYLFHGASIGIMSNTESAYELVDWLNAHHFDYRGLIEKGLALEAPKDMYDNKK